MELVDDLDGSPAQETIRFGIGGTDYEIDLSIGHAEELRAVFAPLISAARRAGEARSRTPRPDARRTRSSSPRQTAASSGAALGEMRQWARANGFPVAQRGRLSREAREAFEATPPEVRAEQAITFSELERAERGGGSELADVPPTAPAVKFSRATA